MAEKEEQKKLTILNYWRKLPITGIDGELEEEHGDVQSFLWGYNQACHILIHPTPPKNLLWGGDSSGTVKNNK